MKKLYLAKTLVSVRIMANTILEPNRTTHQDLVWARDADDAQTIVGKHHAEGTDPERTTIDVWVTEALGDPVDEDVDPVE